MRLPDLSEKFSVPGFLFFLLYPVKPSTSFTPDIVFTMRKLQSNLQLTKFLEYGKMIHWLRAGHVENPNSYSTDPPVRILIIVKHGNSK